MTKQHGGLAEHLRTTARGLIYIMGFLIPLFYLPWTLDLLEINKQTLFVFLTFAAALLWLGSMMAERRVRIRRGWMNLLPLVLVLTFALPALYSVAPYLSWLGMGQQSYTSVLTFVAGAVLFYVVADLFQERSTHRLIHTVLLLSSFLVGLIGFTSLYGVSLLPGRVRDIAAFNTIGTPNALALFLSTMTVFSIAAWISHRKGDSMLHDGWLGVVERILAIALSFITFLVLAAIDFHLSWFVFVAGMGILFVFALFRSKYFPSLLRLALPLVLLLCALPFWFWLDPTPPSALPLEVSLNAATSLDIADKALSEYGSSYGSGPGTYVFNFTQFHGLGLNETDLWSTRFDRANSHVLTLLPTIGYLGIGLLAVFVLVLLARALYQVLKPHSRDEWLESFLHLCPWLMLMIIAFVYPWNFSFTFLFLFFSALIASQVLRKPAEKSFEQQPAFALVTTGLFAGGALLFLIAIFLTTQLYAAEIAFAKAVRTDRAGGETETIVSYLDRAATLNQFNDTYYRTLSEALLLRVGEELSGVQAATELSGEGQQYLQSLMAASVNASVRATDLSPYNVLNWITRAKIYRELIPLQSTVAPFAIESYQKALTLEPLNSSHWTAFARTYLVIAEQLALLGAAEDALVREQALIERETVLMNAETALNRAAELRTNYAPAHFYLAITYQMQGRLDDAIGKLESVATYNPLDIGVHFELGLFYLERLADGDLERARDVLEIVVNLSPSYSNARWFLASVYEQLGDVPSTIEQVEAVLRLNPENAEVQARLDGLLRGERLDEVPEAIE